MAFITCDFFSEALGISTSMNVILPQNTYSQIGMGGSSKKERYPVLYLLHGLSDDHTIWQRRTAIERYVSELGLAVVMPNGYRGFYTDMKHGYKYFTFMTEEFPEIVRQFFPISEKREDTFAAGLSMGGYGAFKLALGCPDKFAAAASLSGALDMAERVTHESIEDKSELYNIFGDLDKIAGSENDLFYLAEKLKNSDAPKPKLFQCCGTEDFLYEDNQNFRNLIKDFNFDYTYEEGPGTHEWGYWDANIQRVLKWLPLKDRT